MPSNQMMETARKGVHWLLIPLLAVVTTLWPTLSSGLAQLQFDPGDTLLNHYFLEHAYQHVRDGQLLNPDHYWSPDYFWPIKDTLAWSDHLIGPAVLYGLFRILLVNPYNAYIGWLMLTLGLNYIALRRALLIISPNTTPSWLSLIALITAFSPAITMQLSHPQLLSLFLIGPILVHCHRLLTEEEVEAFSVSNWLMLGFWLLNNGIFNIYIFVYGCYGALICSLMHIIRRINARRFRIHKGSHWGRSTCSLLAVITANILIYRPYLDSLKTFGKRPMEEIISNLPKPASWICSSNYWLIPPPFRCGEAPEGWIYGVEQQLFPGWLYLILFAASVITALSLPSRRDKELRVWLIAVGFMLIGCISIMDLSLWPLISRMLPGAGSLRASSRVGMVIILFAAPCLALASKHWLHVQTICKRAIALIVGFTAGFCSVLAIRAPSFSLQQWKEKHSSISSALIANHCDVFWQEWTKDDGESWRTHVQAMHVQQHTGIPTLNGLSGQFPKHHWPYEQPSGEGAYAWIALNNPERYHRLRDQPDSLKRCIATWSPISQTTAIRNIEVRKGMPLNLISMLNPTDSLFEGNGIEILSDSNRLFVRYINDPDGHSKNTPLLLTRDGKPIPADRGDFRITNAKRVGGDLFISDTNTNEKLQFVWRVNGSNGVFVDQSMLNLNNQ